MFRRWTECCLGQVTKETKRKEKLFSSFFLFCLPLSLFFLIFSVLLFLFFFFFQFFVLLRCSLFFSDWRNFLTRHNPDSHPLIISFFERMEFVKPIHEDYEFGVSGKKRKYKTTIKNQKKKQKPNSLVVFSFLLFLFFLFPFHSFFCHSFLIFLGSTAKPVLFSPLLLTNVTPKQPYWVHRLLLFFFFLNWLFFLTFPSACSSFSFSFSFPFFLFSGLFSFFSSDLFLF